MDSANVIAAPVIITNPLKQGLKQLQMEYRLLRLFRYNHQSTKTRIETN